jgi:hypothetical protein
MAEHEERVIQHKEDPEVEYQGGRLRAQRYVDLLRVGKNFAAFRNEWKNHVHLLVIYHLLFEYGPNLQILAFLALRLLDELAEDRVRPHALHAPFTRFH